MIDVYGGGGRFSCLTLIDGILYAWWMVIVKFNILYLHNIIISLISFWRRSSLSRITVPFLPGCTRRTFRFVQVVNWYTRTISAARIVIAPSRRSLGSSFSIQLCPGLSLIFSIRFWYLYSFWCWGWLRSGWRNIGRREWRQFGRCSFWQEFLFSPTRCWRRCRRRRGFWFCGWLLLRPSWSYLPSVWGLWICSCLRGLWLCGCGLRRRRVWCSRVAWPFRRLSFFCGLAFFRRLVCACALNLCWYPFTMW